MSTLAIAHSDGTALGSVTEDRSALERIRNGEVEAFEEIVVRYQKRVFGILCRYERDHQKVEDLVQETFLKVWRGLSRYRAKSPFEHWISRIASNVARDHLRRIQRRIRETSFEDMGDSTLDWLSVGNTNRELKINEARQLLDYAMQSLTPMNRMIVTLREIEGQSLKEVSQITGLTTANVKIRSHRAKAKMREALKTLLDKEDQNGAVAQARTTTIQPEVDWQPVLKGAPLAA